MNSTTFSNALLPLAGTDVRSQVEARKPGFLTRLFAAMIESRQKQANREIARIEAAYGFSLRGDVVSPKTGRAELPFQG